MDRDLKIVASEESVESSSAEVVFDKSTHAANSEFAMEISPQRLSGNEPAPKIWSVCSGKGGVGKTFVCTSLAITLTKLGYNVIVCDLDLSGANAHTAMGSTPSHLNIRHFLEGKKSLQECVVPTSIPKLKFIQGFWDSWLPTSLSVDQVNDIMPELRKLRADFVLVDLGAGALPANIQVFDQSDEKILVTNSEPTTVEKTYRFIEAYICQNLRTELSTEKFVNLIHTLQDYRHRILSQQFSFTKYLNEVAPEASGQFVKINSKPLRLLVNGVRIQNGSDIGYGIKSVCQKFFDLKLDYVGAVSYDNAVWQSVASREPVLIAQPFTPLAGQLVTICKSMIEPQAVSAVA